MATEYLSNSFLEATIRRFQTSKRDKLRYELIIEDIVYSNSIREKYNKKSNHDLVYFNEQYTQASNEFIESQKDLAKAFYILAEQIVRYAKDIIVDQDESVQEGVMICFDKIDKFDPERGKAFNYMTTLILNHYRQLYRTSKAYRLFKDRYRDHLINKLENMIIRNGKEKYNYD